MDINKQSKIISIVSIVLLLLMAFGITIGTTSDITRANVIEEQQSLLCLDRFKTTEIRIINNKLYCITNTGVIEEYIYVE